MARRFAPAAWLLLLAMPFHVLTAVYLDVFGSAHFHLEDALHDHGHARAHGHGHLERHHHDAADSAVVTVGDAPDEGSAAGWSATACIGLASTRASLDLAPRPRDIAPDRSSPPQSRSLGRLERPPRIDTV
jgi:hypothetical protein